VSPSNDADRANGGLGGRCIIFLLLFFFFIFFFFSSSRSENEKKRGVRFWEIAIPEFRFKMSPSLSLSLSLSKGGQILKKVRATRTTTNAFCSAAVKCLCLPLFLLSSVRSIYDASK